MKFLPKRDLLTLEELDKLATAFIENGVKKIRITGGEPLVRRDILFLFKRLSRHLESGQLSEMTLTTNGSQMARFAQDLSAMGVKRVNISLDTLDPEKFRQITRGAELEAVKQGIIAAQKSGMKVKINTVALGGFNDTEIPELINWADDHNADITFIELMPMGDDFSDAERVGSFYSLFELQENLQEAFDLRPSNHRSGGPAHYLERKSGQRIGFITPLSHNFCGNCNRVRVSCTGTLYTCLGQEGSLDLRHALRQSDSNEALIHEIRKGIASKPAGHDFDYGSGTQGGKISRTMSHTGG